MVRFFSVLLDALIQNTPGRNWISHTAVRAELSQLAHDCTDSFNMGLPPPYHLPVVSGNFASRTTWRSSSSRNKEQFLCRRRTRTSCRRSQGALSGTGWPNMALDPGLQGTRKPAPDRSNIVRPSKTQGSLAAVGVYAPAARVPALRLGDFSGCRFGTNSQPLAPVASGAHERG